ncbi:MAG: transglycosylase SLT domain-containing protein [Vibrio casei]
MRNKVTFILMFLFILNLSGIGKTYATENKVSIPPYFVNMASLYNIPVDVLYALAIMESNTKLQNGEYAPWPYTMNVNYKGMRFASYEDLVYQSRLLIKQGKTSFDVGFFQVNWKWNGHRSESIEALANPYENARVAAEIMLEEYAKVGSWAKAAGRYHNPANRNGHADRYASDYAKILNVIRKNMRY